MGMSILSVFYLILMSDIDGFLLAFCGIDFDIAGTCLRYHRRVFGFNILRGFDLAMVS